MGAKKERKGKNPDDFHNKMGKANVTRNKDTREVNIKLKILTQIGKFE